jgi:hypothetical protein
MSTVPLASLSPAYHPHPKPGLSPRPHPIWRRVFVWTAGLAFAAGLYFAVTSYWNWKHVLSTSGGRYFLQRVEIPVPAFQQNDPRWSGQLLALTDETVGHAGCAITSAAMVLVSYGVDTDPERLNDFLILHEGYTPDGAVYWEKAAAISSGQVEKAYEDLPSYALIDRNLLAGNPVIIRLTLRNGTTHFVVIVGKEGWDYLTRDPARPPEYGVYPLRELTPRIEALRFYRALVPAQEMVPSL